MHNCKATGEPLTECAECREESDALKETLRITTRIIEATAPPETYWPSYHAKLREKLNQARGSFVETKSSTGGPSWLTRFFTSSVRVPVPVGLALLPVFGLSLLFAIRASQQAVPEPQIVRVPFEVPVVQEKTVTRVVYRQRRTTTKRTKQTIGPSRNDSTLARTQKPPSLVGFKPTDEIKLTVIKGGSTNEK